MTHAKKSHPNGFNEDALEAKAFAVEAFAVEAKTFAVEAEPIAQTRDRTE